MDGISAAALNTRYTTSLLPTHCFMKYVQSDQNDVLGLSYDRSVNKNRNGNIVLGLLLLGKGGRVVLSVEKAEEL
jgi:hypothetical protein